MTIQQKHTQIQRRIVLRLKGKIAKHGYYENMGTGELNAYRDKLAESDLTYNEKYVLEQQLVSKIAAL